MPAEKEPNNLASDEIFTKAGLAAYRALFREAQPGQLCAKRARLTRKSRGSPVCPNGHGRCLGPNLKLIYIVREPVGRALSQYRHQLSMRHDAGGHRLCISSA